ncbi:phage tail tip lysozyme [Rhizobium ruizarguesonis]|uniref:Phage tail tip lysozyme n=1 Tax=Rhizobium ruizarguesonis TaxID=2081791 RepID=A0ACD5EQ75_9HYPH
MLQQGTDTSPIQSPWEGAARMAQALMGGLAIKQQGDDQRAADAQVISAITGQPYTPPEKSAGFLSSIFGGNKTADPGATGSFMPKTDSSGNVALPSTGKEWDTIAPRLVSDLSRDFQLSPEQAAGVVGQLGQESAGFGTMQEVNPLVPGSRGGYGYAQWTGPRRKGLRSLDGRKQARSVDL